MTAPQVEETRLYSTLLLHEGPVAAPILDAWDANERNKKDEWGMALAGYRKMRRNRELRDGRMVQAGTYLAYAS